MGLLKRRGGSKDGPVLTVFHAADIHGADPCVTVTNHEVRSRQFIAG